MTSFVDSFSDQALLPPWQSTGSRHWCFVIDVECSLSQDYLDKYFNAPGPDSSPYHYEALKDRRHFGILVVSDHTNFACTGGKDTVAHREVFWQFPAHRKKKDNRDTDNQLVWIQPFYFDDNASVMFASREIVGSEKQFADIAFEEGGRPDALHLDVAMQGFTKFAPRSRSRPIGVLHIELAPSTKEVNFDKWTDVKEVATFIKNWLGSKAPQRGELRIDTLKQDRDAFDMRKAAYRAIIASKATHSNVKDVRYFKGGDVKLKFAWSDTMREQFTRIFGLKEPAYPDEETLKEHGEDLGSKTEGKSKADWKLPITSKDVLCAVAFRSDARFEVIETLHTYGASVPSS